MGIELMRMALRALWAHRVRSALTMTSILIGSFCIVLMTSLATSGLVTLRADIEALGGASLLFVTPRPPQRSRDKADFAPGYITEPDVAALRRIPFITARCHFFFHKDVEARAASGAAMNLDLLAASAGCLEALGLQVARGRTFSESEDARAARLCVLGHGAAAQLFPSGHDLGEQVVLGLTTCTVIGGLTARVYTSVDLGFDWSKLAVLPIHTQQVEMGNEGWGMLTLRTDHPSRNELVKRLVNTVLEARHHGVDDYELWDFARILAGYDRFFLISQVVVALVAGISLLVGGVGVMNMMLVSVTERTREIGIRKALGASRAVILAQFLVESALVAGLGGLAGVGLGLAAFSATSALIDLALPSWIPDVSGLAVGTAMVAALSIGVGFGLLPARAAAKLDPVAALRG